MSEEVERTGLEPVTFGLQSRDGHDDGRRRPTTEPARRHKPCGLAGTSLAQPSRSRKAGRRDVLAFIWRRRRPSARAGAGTVPGLRVAGYLGRSPRETAAYPPLR
jgi:hypothetical protein